MPTYLFSRFHISQTRIENILLATMFVSKYCRRLSFIDDKKRLIFYNQFFQFNARTIPTSVALLKYALEEACDRGIEALDAIHIACAVFAGAEEFITSEKQTKTIHRTQKVRVVSIYP